MLLEIEDKIREISVNYENEISYSKFISGLNKAGIIVNRKMLSEIAIDNPQGFTELVNIAKDALNGKAYKPASEEKEEVKVEKEVKAPKKAASKEKDDTKKSATKTVKKTATKKESK